MFQPATTRYLKPPAATDGRWLLAIGAPDQLTRNLERAGWRVSTHQLDLGPAADLAGRPFTPPVKRWPRPDASVDAVLLYDQLAHVVDDEAAIAEAARVLKPGGRLLIRVPRDGPLAWLDGFNLYRYLRDFTRRGTSLYETRGIGWRRHYPLGDLVRLSDGRFRIIAAAGEGIGLVELARGALLALFRWLLRSPDGYDRAQPVLDGVARLDDRLSAGPLGYHLVLVAERTEEPAG